jgi:hypothetical protein
MENLNQIDDVLIDRRRELLVSSFHTRCVPYQRKVSDWVFPELLVFHGNRLFPTLFPSIRL